MDIEKVKRYSLIEVVLLAIFMLGLLTAGLIVKLRARIVPSDLISLPGSGLSVSMPTGSGWERTAAWQYEEAENSMMLIGQFGDPGRGGMAVRWRYLFSTPAGSERELLEQKARKIGAAIQSFDMIGSQECPMVYARMLLPQTPREEIYLGIMRLDANRSVELLVRSYGFGGFHGENVLESVAGSIQYHPLQESADGRALMDEFLQTQANRLASRPLPDESFLIKDATGKNLGYYHARHSVSNDNGQSRFRMQIRQFEYNALELKSELWFDPLGKDTRWKTDLIIPQAGRPVVYEIGADESGSLSVKCDAGEIKTFPADQFFLPEPLLSELAYVFLQSEYSGVIVDVLAARGQLVPVYLTKLSPEKAKAKSEAVDAVVRMDFLYHPDSYEELLFDRSQNLLGRFEQQPGRRPRIWDTVSTKALQQIFQEDFHGNATVSVAR
ncbi:MAG: hypothetical protein J7K65_04680 [Planctomycetes bacterium]|nr:hypothetical protein [Planctomycetota bacterium]